MKKESILTSVVVPLILAFILVFSLLGCTVGVIATTCTYSSAVLTGQIDEAEAPAKVQSSLQTTFDTQYNTTAVPSDVYMDVLTETWLKTAMINWIEDAYADPTTVPTVDYTDVEASITSYFASYAEDNDVDTESETYTEKLEEVTEDAEATITDAIDVYQIETMMDAGIWNKVFSHKSWCLGLAVGGGILSLAMLVLLIAYRRRPCYWIGAALFADGVICIVPAAILLGSGIIDQFTLKEASVYAVFTGLIEKFGWIILGIGIVFLLVGLCLWLGSVIKQRTKISATPVEAPESSESETSSAALDAPNSKEENDGAETEGTEASDDESNRNAETAEITADVSEDQSANTESADNNENKTTSTQET